MPTKKKRVGFIPRQDVMRIIDKLSLENNLSNSKIVSILVEEALSIRGIFNKKNGKVTHSYHLTNYIAKDLPGDSGDFIDVIGDILAIEVEKDSNGNSGKDRENSAQESNT